jgi:mono/diheme cytochrome c family protein
LAVTAVSLGPFPAHAAPNLAAQADGKSVWDGVYSEEQNTRGEGISKASCVVCHGDGLTGTDLAPALLGKEFVAAWSGRSVGELYEKIYTTMPADSVGTLKPPQAADLVAHILKLNDFPSGASELGTEMATLNTIRIRSQK